MENDMETTITGFRVRSDKSGVRPGEWVRVAKTRYRTLPNYLVLFC